jgi:hypothetical protein
MSFLLVLTSLLAPLYVWRFTLLGLPLNFLLVWVVLVWIMFSVWLCWKNLWPNFFAELKKLPRLPLLLTAVFVGAGIISLLAFGISQEKLGQFTVLFIQPISLLFIFYYYKQKNASVKDMFANFAFLFVGLSGLLAIVQYFTLFTLPTDYWGNAQEPKRAVGWFAHPDMFGLFLAPLMAWLIPQVMERLNNWRRKINWLFVLAWIIGGIGLLLSMSRGAWLGFGLALIIGVIVSGKKKYWLATGIGLVIIGLVFASVPNLRYRVILPFKGEKSTVARFSLWDTGQKMIADSPVLGKGLNGFANNWERYNTDPNLEHYNFPHNILLNFWVDTGLLGAVSFLGLVVYGIWLGLRQRQDRYKFSLALFLIALVVHGLIDIPYLKNDLALMFWLVYALAL